MADDRQDDSKPLEPITLEALALEGEEARKADALGFMARALVIATLPHKATPSTVFVRRNGGYVLTIMSPPDVGLPYGSIPRLLLSWVTTEAVRTRSPALELGPSLSAFMAELGLMPSWGRWGTVHRLRGQTERLFSSTVSYTYKSDLKNSGAGFRFAKDYNLWWNPKSPDQVALWKSTVNLSLDFFKEIIERPVPIDIQTLKAIKQSPMAIDIYCWMTYRMSYLQKETEIPWQLLQLQFGSDYRRTRDFKEAFVHHLRAVLNVYREAKIEEGKHGLILKPSPPHVPVEPPDLRTLKGTQPPQVLASPSSRPKLTLLPGTFEKAKQLAPRADIYAAFGEWLGWIEDTGQQPEHPDAAFLGFVRKKFSVITSQPSHPLPPRRLVLEPLTLDLAKKLVQGYDVSSIEQAWREHLAAVGYRPEDPNTDFLDFCGQYVQKQR